LSQNLINILHLWHLFGKDFREKQLIELYAGTNNLSRDKHVRT
jgi:hypothetical protein